MFSSLVYENRARFKLEKNNTKDMTHEEFLKAVQHERSLIKRLFKSKAKREKAIKRLIKERFAHLVGKFCKVEDRIYYIVEVYGIAEGKGVKPIARTLRLIENTRLYNTPLGLFFSPYCLTSVELQEAEQNILSKEDASKHLKALVDEIMNNF